MGWQWDGGGGGGTGCACHPAYYGMCALLCGGGVKSASKGWRGWILWIESRLFPMFCPWFSFTFMILTYNRTIMWLGFTVHHREWVTECVYSGALFTGTQKSCAERYEVDVSCRNSHSQVHFYSSILFTVPQREHHQKLWYIYPVTSILFIHFGSCRAHGSCKKPREKLQLWSDS